MKRAHHKKGIALLIALVVIMIVISIIASLSIIAMKEVSFSNIRRESQIAYYAAESGTQCALYWIVKADNKAFSLDRNTQIRCDDRDRNITIPQMTVGATTTFTFGFNNAYETRVHVVPNSTSNLVVTSEGYNRKIADSVVKIQKNQQVEVSTNKVKGFDMMLVIDQSASIDAFSRPGATKCRAEGLPDTCKWSEVIKKEISSFISGIPNVSNSGIKLGQVHFNDMETRLINLTTDRNANINAINSAPAPSGGTNIPAALRVAAMELRNQKKSVSGNSTTYANYVPQTITPGNDRPDIDYPDVIVLVTDGGPDYLLCNASNPSSWNIDSNMPEGRPIYDGSGCPDGRIKHIDIKESTTGLYASEQGMQSTEYEANYLKQKIGFQESPLVFVIGVGLNGLRCPVYNPHGSYITGTSDLTLIPGYTDRVSCGEYLQKKVATQPTTGNNSIQYYYNIEDFSQIGSKLEDIINAVEYSIRIIE
jgi:Tfp pilus assembly protein PilX